MVLRYGADRAVDRRAMHQRGGGMGIVVHGAGKTTAYLEPLRPGHSSRKETYTLSNGLYRVAVPIKAYTGFLDRPIERRGLEPDVEVRLSAGDLAQGKDTVVEAAARWLVQTARQ